jgi:hypothetical protein
MSRAFLLLVLLLGVLFAASAVLAATSTVVLR